MTSQQTIGDAGNQRFYSRTLLLSVFLAFIPATHARPLHTTSAISRPRVLAPIVWGCNSINRGIHLTFDDCPGPHTDDLLDVLKALGTPATFFVNGNGALSRPDALRRMVAEGHTVGSHTLSHANLTDLVATENLAELERQIVLNEEIIFNITGVVPTLFRPPYGAIDRTAREFLGSRGYTVVMWTAGCIDWFFHDMVGIELPVYINGMADAGGLICFHDNFDSQDLVDHLSEFVSVMRGNGGAAPRSTINPEGRRFISISECMADPE
ncbi:hypothetical protein FOA52_011512 [Chlamydomonas sp. UWO 241]|nr:hypothetical protein FOA52_011512 [Chlamydomonas sp. UWO 241]